MRLLTTTRRRPRIRDGRTVEDGTFGVSALVMAPAAAGLAFLVLPLAALLARAPWSAVAARLADPGLVAALRMSVLTSSAATTGCLLFGVPLAWVLARVPFRGRRAVRALVAVPLVLPPVAGGVALLALLGPDGLAGRWLAGAMGLTLPLTPVAVVLAQAFVAMPLLVIGVEGALRAHGPRLEETAAMLGASPWTLFRRVTLPAAAPGIAVGAVLCWARAIGEFGATVAFAESVPGRTWTAPLAAYLALDGDPEAAVMLSLALLLMSVAVLACLRGRWTDTLCGRWGIPHGPFVQRVTGHLDAPSGRWADTR